MHQENTKLIWLILLWFLLYCGGLDPNPQYLWGMLDWPQGGQWQQRDRRALRFWASSNIDQLQPTTPPGSLPRPPGDTLANTQWLVKIYKLKRTSSGTFRALGVSSGFMQQLQGLSLLVRAWQNMAHWRREWQAISIFLPWEPHEQYEKAKRYDTEKWTSQVGRCPICYWGRAGK